MLLRNAYSSKMTLPPAYGDRSAVKSDAEAVRRTGGQAVLEAHLVGRAASDRALDTDSSQFLNVRNREANSVGGALVPDFGGAGSIHHVDGSAAHSGGCLNENLLNRSQVRRSSNSSTAFGRQLQRVSASAAIDNVSRT